MLFVVLALVVLALVLGPISCDSPTSISQESIQEVTVNTPPTECDDVTTELINDECVALTCDEGFELDDDGECVESESET